MPHVESFISSFILTSNPAKLILYIMRTDVILIKDPIIRYQKMITKITATYFEEWSFEHLNNDLVNLKRNKYIDSYFICLT